MTDRLAQVLAHLDRLGQSDPELADSLRAVVARVDAVDKAEASGTWVERVEQQKAAAQDGPKER